MSDVLDVYVHDQKVGMLLVERGEFIFRYDEHLGPDRFVSLTMPVRHKAYVLPDLHPIFEMHLPEGYLLALIQKQFSKITGTDDFGLLNLLAPNIRGRVSYQVAPTRSRFQLNLDELIYPEQNLFEELVQRFALRSALSGVQPKVLAQVENKATLELDDYIVKAWGPEYPELALNEYCCMLAAQHAGIPVPEFYLSDDDQLFIMKRFDWVESSPAFGFEDLCVLQARQRSGKYQGSMEQAVKTIKSFCSPAYKKSAMEQFFKMTILNQRLQNGDAHLKNFGLIYENEASVRLAPAYDMVSTTAYIKNDSAALTLLGSRKWWDCKHLLKFGVEFCDLTMHQAKHLLDECEDALWHLHQFTQMRLKEAKNPNQVEVLSHIARLTE